MIFAAGTRRHETIKAEEVLRPSATWPARFVARARVWRDTYVVQRFGIRTMAGRHAAIQFEGSCCR